MKKAMTVQMVTDALIPLMVCRQTIAGQPGIGGITPAAKLKMVA